jgi:hypothetical protein
MMVKVTGKNSLGGFKLAIRNFYFTVTDLHCNRVWSMEVRENNRKFSLFVTGKAVSEDRVKVIGRDGSVKDFDFTLRVDTDVKELWQFTRQTERSIDALRNSDDLKSETQLIKKINERLDENPPTATLYTFDNDRELGIKGGWSIDCNVPPEIFSKIEDDIAAGAVTSIKISVDWEFGLVSDCHAPPGIPTTWGLICFDEESSPTPLRGHVTMVRWSPASLGGTNPKEVRENIPLPTPATVTALSPVLLKMPNISIIALWILAVATVLHLFK